jgi:glycerol-3-phosphate O-acyltransferase/dihydroxyacetone phosphate acyltransferase
MSAAALARPPLRDARGAEPVAYRSLRGVARLLLWIFYRRIEVVGLDRIPAGGPVILAANHQNALVDPALLLASIPRRLVPVAKAPLFRHPLVGPLLGLIGAIPVHRRQDAGSDPTRNEALFRAAAAALARGLAVLIFPEGVSQPEPRLMPLRTGAARMLLGAEVPASGRLGVKLIPVGLILDEPGTFRVGRALVLVGDPVPAEDCVGLHASEPDRAVRQLTERLTGALGRLIVEAGDRRTLALVRAAEAIWAEESPQGSRRAPSRAEWRRRAVRAYRYLLTRQPGRAEAMRTRLERYAKDLELAGLTDRQLAQPYSPAVVWRYAMRQGTALLLGLPLALWGIANHVIPYQLTSLTLRLLRPGPDVEATYKLGAGVILYPVCWAAEAWLAWRLGGAWWLALFVVSLAPTGFFALTWSERAARVAREARSLFTLLLDRDLRRHLLGRRRATMEEFQALVREVPESVLAGGDGE